jgi:methylthioribose-1-phosphate isomerase
MAARSASSTATASKTRTLEAIRYSRKDGLQILDQLLLPYQTVYEQVSTVEAGHAAIKQMKVRGAPAIAIVAALSVAVEVHRRQMAKQFASADAVRAFIEQSFDYLRSSRPTAVNLFRAADQLVQLTKNSANKSNATVESVCEAYLTAAEQMLADDVADNRRIGKYGAEAVIKAVTAASAMTGHAPRTVLTHCNTGSLATAGFGTALGVIRQLYEDGWLTHAYCTETRPYNQGARLTAYELAHEQIPSTLICDSMVGALMRQGKIGAVVVGADRVAANGDTANKIGTYQLAVLAHHHHIPFFIAAPTTSVDLATKDGSHIIIEERPANELRQVRGAKVRDNDELVLTAQGTPALETVRVAADGIQVWNPSFDVTPAHLIDGIITESGVVMRNAQNQIDMYSIFGPRPTPHL